MDQQNTNTEKMAALGRMTRGIIHDLNNSLASIMGHAEFLTFDLPPNSEQHIFAENIRKAGFQIQDLIDQIRAVAAEKNTAKDICLELVEETQILSERLKGRLTSKQQIVFSSDIDQAFLTLPPHQFRTLIANVIKQKIESLHENMGTITVHISVGALTSKIITFTIDTVVNDKDKLSSSLSDGGLTLKVASEIVQYLGGSLEISTQPDGNMPIIITLPVESILIKEKTSLSASPKSILLVDKNPETLKTISTMLLRDKHKVESLSDGLEAIDFIRENPKSYDILITDSAIPHDSIGNFITEIRQDFKKFPIIVMSGDIDFLQALNDEQTYANIYTLPKPINNRSLKKIIESASSVI